MTTNRDPLGEALLTLAKQLPEPPDNEPAIDALVQNTLGRLPIVIANSIAKGWTGWALLLEYAPGDPVGMEAGNRLREMLAARDIAFSGNDDDHGMGVSLDRSCWYVHVREVIDAAKREAQEKPKTTPSIAATPTTYTVVCQAWEESEAGFGTRPDGYSLHLNTVSRDAFVKAYWDKMPKTPPNSYARPCGNPKPIDVSPNVYVKVVAAGAAKGTWISDAEHAELRKASKGDDE